MLDVGIERLIAFGSVSSSVRRSCSVSARKASCSATKPPNQAERISVL